MHGVSLGWASGGTPRSTQLLELLWSLSPFARQRALQTFFCNLALLCLMDQLCHKALSLVSETFPLSFPSQLSTSQLWLQVRAGPPGEEANNSKNDAWVSLAD